MALIFEDSVAQDEPSSPTFFPSRDPAAPPAAPSILALRYGQSTHKMFVGTGKSGITPIRPPNVHQPQPPSPETLRRADIHEQVQRHKLFDFATWELVDSGSWIRFNSPSHDFGNCGIHSLFDLKNWLPGNIPLGHGLPGVWEAKNQVVWNIMEPSLKLATLLIETNTTSSWIDALTLGPRKNVPQDEMASLPYFDGSPDQSFHHRSQEDFIKGISGQAEWFNRLAPHVRIAIGSARTQTHVQIGAGLVYSFGGTHLQINMMTEGLRNDEILITIHIHLLEPLLRGDLSRSERLSQQSYVGIALAHEIIHALGIFIRRLNQPEILIEPFYQEEEIAELGISWETSVFTHGKWSNLVRQSDLDLQNYPVLGQVISNWPNWIEFGVLNKAGNRTLRRRRPQRFEAGSTAMHWPIHMSFTENLQQLSYWQVQIRKYASQALQPPRITGRRVVKSSLVINDVKTVYGPDYYAWMSATGNYISKPPSSLIADDVAKWEWEQRVRIRADAILTATTKELLQASTDTRDSRRVRDWEIRRRNSPLPLGTPEPVAAAELRLMLRKDEMEETQAAIEAQYATPDELAEIQAENLKRENLAKDTLLNAIKYLNQEDTTRAFRHATDVVTFMRDRRPMERFLKARAHLILGALDMPHSRDHILEAINIFRAFEATQTPGIDGKWGEWIFEARGILGNIDEKQRNILRQQSGSEQARIDEALKALWLNNQERAAELSFELLTSKFTATRAQAHLVLARLRNTGDRAYHATQAKERLQKLIKQAPDERDWAAMRNAANWVLNPQPKWIDLWKLDPKGQQTWLDQAQQLVAAESKDDQREGLKIYVTFSKSQYLKIRAQCHVVLMQNKAVGDEIFRRLEAFEALNALQILVKIDAKNPQWPQLLASTEAFLGGTTFEQWQAAVEAAGAQDIKMDDVCQTADGV